MQKEMVSVIIILGQYDKVNGMKKLHVYYRSNNIDATVIKTIGLFTT